MVDRELVAFLAGPIHSILGPLASEDYLVALTLPLGLLTIFLGLSILCPDGMNHVCDFLPIGFLPRLRLSTGGRRGVTGSIRLLAAIACFLIQTF